MGRISQQSQLDLVARISITSAESGSKVIFDIASLCINCFCALLGLDALEFGHNDLHGLSDDVCKCIEATSVRHSNDKSPGALLDGGVNAEFESRDESFTAFEAKPLHRVKFASHKGAPLVRPVKTGIHVHTFTFRGLTELNRFKFFTNPCAHLAVLDMHELNGNFVAVSLTVGIDQLAENPLWFSLNNSASKGHLNGELSVHVSLSEAVVGRVQKREELFVGEAEFLRQARAVFVVLLQV